MNGYSRRPDPPPLHWTIVLGIVGLIVLGAIASVIWTIALALV